MRKTEFASKDSEGLKKALIVGEEARICELVSLIIKDLGFVSMQLSKTEWLIDSTEHIDPELIIWDLSAEQKLSPFQNLCELKKQLGKKLKIMFLGGVELKNTLNVCGDDKDFHFCIKPFSPTKLRHEIGQLYGESSDD
jgi:DNA-binding response OmpR family regulator